MMLGAGGGHDVRDYVRAEMRETDEGRVVGLAPASSYLRGPHGGVRTGVLLTLLDYAGGFCAGLAALPRGWVVSTNMQARVVELTQAGPLRIESSVTRLGRNSVITPVRMFDEGADDALVADGMLTSAILVPPEGAPRWDRPARIEAEPPHAGLPSVQEWLGLRTIDEHTVEVDLTDDLRNPWGMMHGGVLASIIDLAAEHATGGTMTDVTLHFLAPNRTGPVRATARPLGRRADGTVCRVEVRDEGAQRVTALAVVTARAS